MNAPSLKTVLACLMAATPIAAAQTPPEPTSPDPEPSTPTPEATTDCPPDAIPSDCPNAPQPAPPPAQPAPEPQAQTPPPSDTYVVVEEEDSGFEWPGVTLTIGGGIDDFVDDDMRATTEMGGSWNVRGTFGARSYLAFEASYIGSAQGIEAFDIDTDAVLVGNGAQGALRLNATTHMAAQPFLYGGAAWRHYNVTNEEDFVDLGMADSDDVFEVPVGIGITGRYAGFTFDARGEYRFAMSDDLVPNLEDGGMDRWGVMANVGAEL
jgi:hypothetical protein